MAAGIQSPEKELRFTRSRQALAFWILAALCVAGAVTLLASSAYRDVNPALPHPLWALAPVAVAALAVKLAWHLTRHAYLILTPLGIEIFPFFRPAAGMRLVSWQEISDAEADDALECLTLHYNVEKTSGIRLSLRPIPREKRTLLAKAVSGRVSRHPFPAQSPKEHP